MNGRAMMADIIFHSTQASTAATNHVINEEDTTADDGFDGVNDGEDEENDKEDVVDDVEEEAGGDIIDEGDGKHDVKEGANGRRQKESQEEGWWLPGEKLVAVGRPVLV
jgi:hypothetical protein